LEEYVEQLYGVKYAIAVSSATAALHLSLMSLGVGRGDEVIVPAYSFVATANAVELTGAKAIFADISLSDLNICSSEIERLVTDRTRAIIPVHEFGLPADMESINRIAHGKNLTVIEDAACAFGVRVNGNFVGSESKLSCFSFHPRKIVTSGEGGLVLTSDSAIAEYVQSMRSHGLNTVNSEREFIRAGFNYRMSDLGASLLIGQIYRLDEIIQIRARVASEYVSRINNEKITIVKPGSGIRSNWQTFVVLVASGFSADSLISHLGNLGIESAKPAQFIPSEPSFNGRCLNPSNMWPNASQARYSAVALPLHHKLSENEIEKVIEGVNNF
jgi:perosamine synthetase